MQFNNSSSTKKQNMTTLHLKKSISRSPSRLALLLIPLVFACFALSQSAQGVVPPPDGGYPGGNTAEGQNALLSLTTGPFNTAVGWLSLFSNTDGSFNTAVGAGALALNIGDQGGLGNDNTAVGTAALLNNINGYANTAIGSFALFNNGGGVNNTAVGHNALTNSTSGNANVAVGTGALANHATGSNNTAVGRDALLNDTTGESNVAIGRSALVNNTSGVTNIAIGTDSGTSVSTASNIVCIGFGVGGANVDDTTWIGNVFGVTTQSGTTAPVIVSNNGQLGTVASSERFKKDIASMQKTSEAILALRPVTFHYRTDAGNTPQFGLIAEEVAKVNPALVLPDKEGKPYTVRYEQVNAMLLNEFLKEHKTVQEQGAMIARQQKAIETLTAGLQKVSAQLEMSKPAPKTVLNNQ
jgi:Chaperone of endosialidase